MRFLALHAATTATCERSFKLSMIVKTNIRSTMTDKRMNHLCICKHHKKELHELDIGWLMKKLIHVSDEPLKTFGPSICKF